MYASLGKYYLRMFADGAKPSLVLAYGRAQLHEGFRASILSEAASPADATEDDETDARDAAGRACAAWIADDRRKAFLAEIGAGTIDQALLAALPSRYAALRLLGLWPRIVANSAHSGGVRDRLHLFLHPGNMYHWALNPPRKWAPKIPHFVSGIHGPASVCNCRLAP